MSIEITSLSQLDSTKVAAIVAKLTALMQEKHPEVELTRGVFHDLVLYFNGMLNAAVQENIDRILRSKSLLQITQDPTLADTDLVDQTLSNFNITRDAGTKATGLATFILSLPVRTQIPVDNAFEINSLRFYPTNSFTILPPGYTGPTAETDKIMIPIGDGTYAATLPLCATTAGSAGNIKRGTNILPTYLPDNVTDIYATSDFVDGKGPSTNEEYLAKLSTGLAAKAIGGRKSYEALIRSQSMFENVLHLSIIGAGEAEQHRDQHSLFPISGGGKIDVYVQPTPYAQEIDHVVTATFVGNTANGTLWQASIERDMAPGFYAISRVTKPKRDDENDQQYLTGSYNVVQDNRGLNITLLDYVPDIQYQYEGAYSRYQYANVRFEDTDKMATGLVANSSKAQYVVTTLGLPLIGELDEFLTSRDNRSRATDILVKAAVPCFTKINFAIHVDASDNVSDDTILQMKKSIVAAIAKIGFSGQLHASVISGAAHKYLTGRQAVNEIDMFGQIRRPDGSIHYLRDKTRLTIPADPARLVTGRTTVFLTSPDDIEITPVVGGFLH